VREVTDLVVHDIGELVVGPANGSDGRESTGSSLDIRADGAVAIADGEVVAVGDSAAVCREHPPENADRALGASGQLVTPGLVDAHTHALFAGDRSGEFLARIEGKSYTEIMNAGGGIPVTVEAVRAASDEQLLDALVGQLDVMLAHGTTTAEVKSGYGLDVETELRMLEVIDRADATHPVDIVPTFMGAHAVPGGTDADAYVDRVVSEQLPAVAEQGVARFCDVFCEEGVFDVEQSRRVLRAGREHGLDPKIHAEEFARVGGAQLAAEVGATSADHLLQATGEDAAALAEAGVTPVLLPATAFALSESYADPGPFLDAGATVGLGTDLNPSCFVHSMGLVVSLACLRMGVTPDEALRGATAGAARALGYDGRGEPVDRHGDRPGTLREGTAADLVVFDLPDHVHLPYNAGTNRVETVVADGEVVHVAGAHGRGGELR
jgi:imidazolonepropionase